MLTLQTRLCFPIHFAFPNKFHNANFEIVKMISKSLVEPGSADSGWKACFNVIFIKLYRKTIYGQVNKENNIMNGLCNYNITNCFIYKDCFLKTKGCLHCNYKQTEDNSDSLSIRRRGQHHSIYTKEPKPSQNQIVHCMSKMI